MNLNFKRVAHAILMTTALVIGGAMEVNAQDQISELLGNPPGGDPATQEVELLGTPNAAFDLWLVSIESDPGGSNPGDINNFENVTGAYDADGRAVVEIEDLENPSFTLVLCDNFTGDADTLMTRQQSLESRMQLA